LEEAKQALEIKSKIAKTDKEIDRMVYELYGLTEEEIGIVEG
jgi:type II restriction/modification system DNA methylase subunit YeeA